MTLKEFMEKPDSAVLAEAAKCGSQEELKAFFASRGISVTDGEAEKLYALVSKKMTELSDEELDRVAGGGWYWEVYDCPRGHTTITYYFLDSTFIADSNCRTCEYVKKSTKDAYCTKRSEERYWAGDWTEW